MECHLIVPSSRGAKPLCEHPWIMVKTGKACGYETEHQARKAKEALAKAGTFVQVRRGPCPEAVKLDQQRAEASHPGLGGRRANRMG